MRLFEIERILNFITNLYRNETDTPSLSLAGLIAFSVAEPEVFDLGDLNQYTLKHQSPPALTGNSVWLSGTEENGGFDIGISPDVKAKVQGVIEGCGQLDDQCYKDTHEVLRSANFEVDHKLERRAFRHFLSKTIKGAWDIFLDISAVLYISWDLKSKEQNGDFDSFAFIPASKAAEAAKLQTATELVISAGGTAVATIKPTPNPTGLKGSHAPSITAVTSAQNGLTQGDFIVSMDQDLASRMQEIMMRMTECEDGAKFDSEHPTKRRASSRLGRAICAYHAVLLNMGGTLSDLMQTDLGGLNLAIPATPPDRVAAYELAQQLTEDYAPLIDLQVDRVRALAAYLFALTIGVTLEGQTLGANNRIPSTLVQTGSPTKQPTQTTAVPSASSSSGCPDPTATPIFCGQEDAKENNCEGILPKATGDFPKCAEKGDYPNCPCNMPTLMIVQSTSDTELKAMKRFMELFRIISVPVPDATPSPEPETPKQPTKALGILTDMLEVPQGLSNLKAFSTLYWKFFATDYGREVACREDPIRIEARTINRGEDVRQYPGGEFPLELFGEKCTYKNSGDNVGKLFCGDRAIECFWDPPSKNPASVGEIDQNFYKCKKNWIRQTIFTCPF